MRGAVVVASLLSQLSQQCGAALVRVRDERARSITFSRVVARRAVLPSCVAQASAHTACAGPGLQTLRQCGVEANSRPRTDSRPIHRGAAEKTREKQIPILGGARAKP